MMFRFDEFYRDVCMRIRNTGIAHNKDNIIAKDEKERTKILSRRCMRHVIMKETMASANPGIHPQALKYPTSFHIPSLGNISGANGESDMIMATTAKIRARSL